MLLLTLTVLFNSQLVHVSSLAVSGAEGAPQANNLQPAAAAPTAVANSPQGSSNTEFMDFLANMCKFYQYVQTNKGSAGCSDDQKIICSILVANPSAGQMVLTSSPMSSPMTVAQCQQACNQSSIPCVAYEITNVTSGVRNVYPVNGNSGLCNCGGSSATLSGLGNNPAADTLYTGTTAGPATTSSSTTTPTTTTPTSTTTPTTTRTTTPTPSTTTTPPPLSSLQVAFTADAPSSFSTVGSAIPLTDIVSDYNGHYSSGSNSLSLTAGGIYFAEMCVGVPAGSMADVRLQNSAPLSLGLSWNATSQNGVITQCRSGIIQTTSPTQIQMVLDSGSVYSDNVNELTTMTVFSVSNSMSDQAVAALVYAVAPETTPYVNNTLKPIPLTPVIAPANPSVFNGPQATYVCQVTGPHLVAVSAGILAGIPTILQITVSTPGSIDTGVVRTTLKLNGVTTQGRNVIVNCNQGDTITYNVVSGSVTNSDGKNNYNLTTFTVFPYLPRAPTPSVAWGIYKWYIAYNNQNGAQQPLDPFYFTNVTTNVGDAFDVNSRYVTVPYTGYYYICITSGAGVGMSGSTFTFQLQDEQNTVLLSVQDQSNSQQATDMYGQCGVFKLQQNERIRCVGAGDSYFYSSIANYELSWIGMLLYTTSS